MLIDISTCFGKSPQRRVRHADAVTNARMFDEPGPVRPTTQDVDWSLDNLLTVLDRHQVTRALTYSLRGKRYDFVTGNDETCQAAREHPQLVPVATIDPRRHFGCREEVRRCIDRGFGVFRFFPDEQGWSISSLPFLNICEQLAEHRVAVMLPAGGWGQQTAIANLICPFGFTTVAMAATFGVVAESIAVARQCHNLLCDTSAMCASGAVEAMVAEAGAAKLLFGSNSPEFYFQAAHNLVAEAQISDADRDAILGQNALRHLLPEGCQ